MTKLPEKELLSGTKTPRTTTGEMKDALGKIREYLNDLLGEDSADKEGARTALGIDLTELTRKIESKADEKAIQTAIENKVDNTEWESKTAELEAEIAKRGTPAGTIEYFAMKTPPAGYLKADGSAVGRATYPELFAVIGTVFGAGDGETTFNLPDLMNRFAQGSATPGQKFEAGLPNITGRFTVGQSFDLRALAGAFEKAYAGDVYIAGNTVISGNSVANFNASLSHPIYGNADTVQPPALTLLPCIKAFDALTDSGSVDISGLANDVNGKLDKVIDNKPVRYIVDAFDDGTSWWREWSDGWVEQGGNVAGGGAGLQTISLYKPYAGSYTLSVSCKSNDSSYWATFSAKTATTFQLGTKNYIGTYTFQDVDWVAYGRGA